jgi:hypothetical protein
MSVIRSSRPLMVPFASRIRRQPMSARRSEAGSASSSCAVRRQDEERPDSSAWILAQAPARSSGVKIRAAAAPAARSTPAATVARSAALVRTTRPARSISRRPDSAPSNSTRIAASERLARSSSTRAGRAVKSRTSVARDPGSASPTMSSAPGCRAYQQANGHARR